jgi:type VI secretion system protein ImpH
VTPVKSMFKSALDRLKAAPHRFDPFEALRHLDHHHRTTGRVRVRGALTNRYVPAPLTAVSERPDGDSEIGIAFVGLTGPLGVLPPPYTETALLARKRRSHSLTAFLDMFVQRCAELFVRAAEKYRLPAQVARNTAKETIGSDGIAEVLFALIGLALPALRGRLSLRDRELFPYAGLLSNRTRSAAGLAIMLEDLLGLPVRILPFSGRWVEVAPSEQTRLDGLAPQYCRLGIDTVAGSHIWDVQGMFRIVVGPLGYADFLSLSPRGERMRRLVDAARFYSGPTLSFDIQLVLAKEAIPECQLLGKSAILGWNTWSKSLPSMHDSHDAIHSPER